MGNYKKRPDTSPFKPEFMKHIVGILDLPQPLTLLEQKALFNYAAVLEEEVSYLVNSRRNLLFSKAVLADQYRELEEKAKAVGVGETAFPPFALDKEEKKE